MQLLTVSAAVFQRYIAQAKPGDSSTQYEILLSVTDASGNQIEGLGLGSVSCFMDFIDGVGIAPATVTDVDAYGKGLYRVLATPGNQKGSDPRLLAVIVEQREFVIAGQQGEVGVRQPLIARGQIVITALHCAECCSLNPAVNGVVAAYNAINPNGMKISIDCSGLSIPDYQGTEHFQGIQLLKRGPFDPGTIVITSSSSVVGGFFVACEMSADGLNGRAFLPTEMATLPLSHAGGCQASGHCLGAGLENHDGNSMSEVQFWDFKRFPKQLVPMTIPRIGQGKKSTAGAIGISSLGSGAVVAVGSYNSATIDFYASDGDPFRGSPLKFRSTWTADESFPPYQNLNLILDTNSQLYMLAFWRDGDSNDWMDLFEVDFDGAWNPTVAKVVDGGKHMICTEPCNFNAGAGIYIPTTGGFEVFAVSYYPSGDTIHVNHFAA
jgi:hypothetical protein